jgi:DNA polymerase (family 10)
MRDVIKYGVATARRGWLEPKDVVNTRGLEEVMKVMKRGRTYRYEK